MTDEELAQAVEKVTVFAKLSPDQKSTNHLQIKSNGHVSAIWEMGSMMPLL